MTEPKTPGLAPVLTRLQATQLPYRDRLAQRIEHLAGAFSDDYEGRPLSVRSMAGLIDFLQTVPPSGYPDLTLTPDGDCYAEWRGSQGRKVAIEFLDLGVARYVLFRPNPQHPNRIDHLAGTTTIDALQALN